MSTEFLVRLEKEQAARLKSVARKRSTTQSAILCEALDKFLASEVATRTSRTRAGRLPNSPKKATSKNGANDENEVPPSGWAAMAGIPRTKPGEGVGWREHFRELKKKAPNRAWPKGQHPEDELREMDNDRPWR